MEVPREVSSARHQYLGIFASPSATSSDVSIESDNNNDPDDRDPPSADMDNVSSRVTEPDDQSELAIDRDADQMLSDNEPLVHFINSDVEPVPNHVRQPSEAAASTDTRPSQASLDPNHIAHIQRILTDSIQRLDALVAPLVGDVAVDTQPGSDGGERCQALPSQALAALPSQALAALPSQALTALRAIGGAADAAAAAANLLDGGATDLLSAAAILLEGDADVDMNLATVTVFEPSDTDNNNDAVADEVRLLRRIQYDVVADMEVLEAL
jgi:hypothetical protein